MSKSILLFLFPVLLIGTGCKKDVAQDNEPVPAPGEYFPLTVNSNWDYIPGNNMTGFLFSGMVSGNSRTVNGKTFRELNYNHLNGNPNFANLWDTTLFRKENGKYYQAIYSENLPLPLTNTSNRVLEFQFMEDNAPVRSHWSNSIKGTYVFGNGSMPAECKIESEIAAFYPVYEYTDTAFNFGEKITFKDVIKVRISTTTYLTDPNNNVITANSPDNVYENYYARGVGLVKIEGNPLNPFSLRVNRYRVF